MRVSKILFLLVWAMLLSACPKPATMPDDTGGGAMPAEGDMSGQQGASQSTLPSGMPMTEEERRRQMEQERLGQTVIYFDFDESSIKPAYTDVIAAHAGYLAGGPGRSLRLEGHADERGSREYNIGLGDRRAQAVRQALVLAGASNSQITTVSYGEERPAQAGHDEASWARNRRVEIVYTSR